MNEEPQIEIKKVKEIIEKTIDSQIKETKQIHNKRVCNLREARLLRLKDNMLFNIDNPNYVRKTPIKP
jgi:hypothetical protein